MPNSTPETGDVVIRSTIGSESGAAASDPG